MKKTYIKPESKLIEVISQSIMVGSNLEVSGTTNQNLSREGNSFWDDDEEY